jgi:hypothetical protein
MTLHYFSQLLKWISNVHGSWMVIYNTTFSRWCAIMCTTKIVGCFQQHQYITLAFEDIWFHRSSKLGMERNVFPCLFIWSFWQRTLKYVLSSALRSWDKDCWKDMLFAHNTIGCCLQEFTKPSQPFEWHWAPP